MKQRWRWDKLTYVAISENVFCFFPVSCSLILSIDIIQAGDYCYKRFCNILYYIVLYCYIILYIYTYGLLIASQSSKLHIVCLTYGFLYFQAPFITCSCFQIINKTAVRFSFTPLRRMFRSDTPDGAPEHELKRFGWNRSFWSIRIALVLQRQMEDTLPGFVAHDISN